MIFLSLVVVLAIVYWLGSAKFIQFDGWFRLLVSRLQKVPGLKAAPWLVLAIALLIPLVVLVVIFALVYHNFGKAYLFFLYVPVLLYSLGRGDLTEEIGTYIEFVNKRDAQGAQQWVERMGARAADISTQNHSGEASSDAADNAMDAANVSEISNTTETCDVTEAPYVIDAPHAIDSYTVHEPDTDWAALHRQALKVFAYRGFERIFAVVFWFVIIGPFGALLYRLSALYREQCESGSQDAQVSAKWLWLLELPAVRLMGLTWAFVGNFEAGPLRRSLLDMESSSARVLNECLRAALGAPLPAPLDEQHAAQSEEELAQMAAEQEAEAQDIIEDLTGDYVATQVEPAYSFALIKSSLPLYKRALLFWVCAIAFATLFL